MMFDYYDGDNQPPSWVYYILGGFLLVLVAVYGSVGI